MSKVKNPKCALGLLVLLLGTYPLIALRVGEPRLVVHRSNPVSSVDKEELARLYLGKQRTWSHGAPVQAVDQVPATAIRQSFSEDCIGREVSAVKNYWQRMIFSGRGIPPVELRSDSEVLDYVRSNPGAIGYVSTATPIGDGVKVIAVSE